VARNCEDEKCHYGGVIVLDEVGCESARESQDLEGVLVSRERVRDIDRIVALYEPFAVIDCGGRR
jgi:hypothetical protein